MPRQAGHTLDGFPVGPGLAWGEPVDVVATSNVTISTLNAGDTVDGVTLLNWMRVLLTGQTDAAQNGVYLIGQNAPARRAPDCCTPASIFAGKAYYCTQGTRAGTVWACSTTDEVAVGTTETTWVQVALEPSANLSDLASVSTARTNLGLGGAALLSVGTSAGTVAAGDDSRIVGNGLVGVDTSAGGPSNTAAETTLATFSTTAAALDVLTFVAFGDMLNNTGSPVTVTLAFKIGSTTVATSNAVSCNSGAQRREWWCQVDVVCASTSSQLVGGGMVGPGATTADAWPIATSSFNGPLYGSASEDTTSAKAFTLTATLGTASSSADFLCRGAYLRRAR